MADPGINREKKLPPIPRIKGKEVRKTMENDRTEDGMRKEQKKPMKQGRQAMEQAYLMYYNRVLLSQGLISEREHSLMAREISRRGGEPS